MKKFLAILFALVLVIGTVSLAGCSKKNNGDGNGNEEATPAAADVKVPDGYEQVTFDNEMYGIRFSTVLPQYEGLTGKENGYGRYRYEGMTNAAEYDSYSVWVDANVSTESIKDSDLSRSGGTVETIQINGLEAIRYQKDDPSSGKETDYDIYIPYMDGYARVDIAVSYLNDDVSEEQWNELINAVETYTTVEILDTNLLTTDDGKPVDSSNTMAFSNPSTIAGQSVELKQTIRANNHLVEGNFTVDGIPHKIYACGTVNDSVYNSRKENTEEYPAYTSGDNTYYCHMINRFPNVECDIYFEIDGIYYNFYIYRDHNLDVDANKAFVADSANGQIFADMAADFVGGATVNAANYIG